MRNLAIMPAMAQNRERMNLGEYAEEVTIIVDEPVRPVNHFIEANTQEVTLHHLTSQPTNFWNLTRLVIMKGQLFC